MLPQAHQTAPGAQVRLIATRWLLGYGFAWDRRSVRLPGGLFHVPPWPAGDDMRLLQAEAGEGRGLRVTLHPERADRETAHRAQGGQGEPGAQVVLEGDLLDHAYGRRSVTTSQSSPRLLFRLSLQRPDPSSPPFAALDACRTLVRRRERHAPLGQRDRDQARRGVRRRRHFLLASPCESA